MTGQRENYRFALWLGAVPLLMGFLAVAWSRDLAEWLPLGNLGAFFMVAVVVVEAGAIVLVDWNSESPRIQDAALWQAGRMMVYAVPLGLAILTTVMVAGSADCETISLAQAGGGQRWLVFHDPFNMIACGIYFLSGLGCAGRSSFADQRKNPFRDVAGGLLFLLCAMQTTFWLGAWYDPFGGVAYLETISRSGPSVANWSIALAADALGVAVFAAKAFLVMRVHVFAQGILPRLRRGQVARIGQKILIPLGCGNLMAAAAYLWLVEPLRDFQRIMQMLLAIAGLAGAVWLAGFISFRYLTKRATGRGVSAARRL